MHQLVAGAIDRLGQQLEAHTAQENKSREDRQGGGRWHQAPEALGDPLKRHPGADDHQGDDAHAGQQGAQTRHRQLINGDVELHQIAGQAHAIQQKGHRQNPLKEGTGQTRQQEARHLLQADGVSRQPTGKGHKGEGEQAPHVRKDQGQRRQHLNGKVHLILELLLAHPWSQVRRTGLVEELFGELHQDRQHHEHVRGGKGDGQWGAEAAQQLAHRNRRHPGNDQGQKQTGQQ